MFIDARSVPNGAVVEAEVCVVGAGAAGITLAREFNNCRRASGKRWDEFDSIQRTYMQDAILAGRYFNSYEYISGNNDR
jgi:hypothetical protein